MANTATNVQAGKPSINGAIYCAPLGTALPANASEALTEDYKPMGYVSEDGVTNDNAPENTKIKAWGGDTVLSTQTNKEDTLKYTLLEALNVNVLKAVYGDENVTGSVDTGLTVLATTEEVEAMVYVIDLVLGDVNKRIVVPNGKISALDTITYKDDSAVGYGLTIDCISTYVASAKKTVTHLEYLKTA